MGFYVSAGVYVREKDISDIIPNLSTVTAGLVGYSAKGDASAIRLITDSRQFIEEYGEPVPGQYFHYSALAFLAQGKQLYCRRVMNGALHAGLKIMSTGGVNAALVIGEATPAYGGVSGEEIAFYVFAKDPGVWNNKVGIRVTNLDAVNYEFDIEVYYQNEDGDYIKEETWTVSRQADNIDGNGRNIYLETRVNGFSKYIQVFDNTGLADTAMPEAQASTLVMAGGIDGSAVIDANVIAGWDDFANPDNVDIRLLINGGYTSVAVQTAMKAIAESRKDCVALLDMPYTELSSVANMVTWRTVTQNFNSSYCALYAPWLSVYDPYNARQVDVPPSGYVAAQFAYSDYVADPWYPAAGFNRGKLNILSVTNVFTQGERDTLYPSQINPIQMFRGEGIAIWGQKTMQTRASALDRINVRRLLITIEKAISIALHSFVFELNSDITRFRVVAIITQYLENLAARGAFQTEAKDNGYRIVCDITNNTPAVIDANELHVDILVKPARAAEFIQLQTVITSTGASFEEILNVGTLL